MVALGRGGIDARYRPPRHERTAGTVADAGERAPRRRLPDRPGADGLHRACPARVGRVQRRRARHHRDVVGAARPGARRDHEDARPDRQAVRGEHRAAVRAGPRGGRRLRRGTRRALRDHVGRRPARAHRRAARRRDHGVPRRPVAAGRREVARGRGRRARRRGRRRRRVQGEPRRRDRWCCCRWCARPSTCR